jgi:hypothetical protein
MAETMNRVCTLWPIAVMFEDRPAVFVKEKDRAC